ncbi:MAG: triose-phosphate isomerase [Caldisericota bacterium]|nr:triose-phosphate isomerase [Caldisericota bacterium]
MRDIILAGNWKMHKTIKASKEIAVCLKEKFAGLPLNVIIFPSFTALYFISELLKGTNISVGGQNVYFEKEGAFTGEISPIMLKEAGARYVIVGHSERRNIFKEPDELIKKKIRSVVENGMDAILCVGEKIEERDAGRTEEVINKEIRIALDGISREVLDRIIVAYEPVWAIGAGVTASPDEAADIHKFIRSILDDLFGRGMGENTTILYGGSIKPKNFREFAILDEIDGGLVGGASLKCEDFYDIGKILADCKKL